MENSALHVNVPTETLFKLNIYKDPSACGTTKTRLFQMNHYREQEYVWM